MNATPPRWLSEGRGTPPQMKWSFVIDAPLAAMDYAAEAGTLLVADQTGGLYRFDRRGRVSALSRGFDRIRQLSWADRGNTGTAVLGDDRIVFLAQDLTIEWSVELSESILSSAATPFGEHLSVSLANGLNYILRSDRKRMARFETPRPIRFSRFLHSAPELVLAAEYGFLGKFDLRGRQIWDHTVWSNVGSMAVSSDGGVIAVSVFNHGIQQFSAEGESSGRYHVEGTPHMLGVSETGNRLAVGTLEKHLYWIDRSGEMLWATTTPETVRFIAVSPFGESLFLGFEDGRLMALAWNGG